MRDKVSAIIRSIDYYWAFIITFLLSLTVFIFAADYNSFFAEIMSVATYLTWHNLFEFLSILASFSIFIVTYYTYDESESLRMIILSAAFLVMGVLDVFHTLSYKGTVDFFIPNTGANRATTFWILSRMISSIGILIAFFTPMHKKSKVRKGFFIFPAWILIITLFLLVTYQPDIFPAMFIEGQGLSYEKVMMEYLIILFMGIALLKLADEYRKTRSQQGYLLMIGMLLCIFSEFAFVSYASVYDAYNYLGHIYKFTAFFIMFKALYTDNVRVPYREMKKARNELKKYTENLNFLVKQQTKKIEDVNERLIMDLEYAKDIQRSFLPAKMPEDITVSFEAGYLAAERLSGDFYNVIKLDENNIALYIGDVAGHGVSAAMLMVFANQNIKPLKETEDSVEIISPGYALKNLYKAFNQTNFKAETYMVMLYGIYNTQSRVFTYASGGMNVPPLIVKNSGGIIEMDAAGFAICKLGDVIMPFFEDKQIQLESGDKLLFYTDGLVEAENQEGYKYTSYHLNELVKENHSLNIHGFADAIRNDIFEFVENEGRLKDDVTFLIMEVH